MSYDFSGPKLYKIVKHEKTGKYWILANNPHYNLASDICGENYNFDSQRLKSNLSLNVFREYRG